MIFDMDVTLGVIILIVGMGFFTISMVEHIGSYTDALKMNILYDKASDQLKSLISDGTLESAILLINNGNGSRAEEVLRNRINLENYILRIGNYTITEGDLSNSNTRVVCTVVIINRTEGWYGIYGNDTNLYITDRYFLSENETYQYLISNKSIYPYKRAIYYFRTVSPIQVTLIYGG